MLCGKYEYVNAETQLGDKSNPRVVQQMRQDKRVAQAHVMVVGSRQNAIPNLLTKVGEAKTQEYEKAWTRYESSHQSIAASGADDSVKRAKLDAIKKQYDADKVAANKKSDERVQKLNDLDGRPALQHFWTDYAKDMDEQRAAERKKKEASTHGFGRLKLVKSLNTREWPGGIADFAQKILNDPEFKPNRAAFVGVASPGGGKGHAIALQRLNVGDKFYLFDPNFGVYELFGTNKVRDAMVYLFTIHYPNSIAGGNDDRLYEKNGKAWGEYAVFESTQPAAQGVKVLAV
jgi:hypothetical protein